MIQNIKEKLYKAATMGEELTIKELMDPRVLRQETLDEEEITTNGG